MPRQRRGRGDGTVYQRPDGYWVGQINLGWQAGPDGKRTRPIPMLEPVAFLLDSMPREGKYVFYGKECDSRADWGAWKDLLVKAGVCPPDMARGDMPALHAARGTTASLLHEAGVPDKIISEILGHSSVQITRQAYIHGNEDRHRAAMKALEAFVSPPPEAAV